MGIGEIGEVYDEGDVEGYPLGTVNLRLTGVEEANEGSSLMDTSEGSNIFASVIGNFSITIDFKSSTI
jgi:hypothetical protein